MASGLLDTLRKWKQHHILEQIEHDTKSSILTQLLYFEQWYVGGLDGYMTTATEFFHAQHRVNDSTDASINSNPFSSWIPSIPQDKYGSISLQSSHYEELESIGLDHVGDCAFVVVAGGLGERLGYNGIKLALPIETITGTTYLQAYIDHILALQALVSERLGKHVHLPLAIMTSDVTHRATESFLKKHEYFGMNESQIILLQQDTVPCLMTNPSQPSSLQLVLNKDVLVMKPHGHGDVHTLLYSSGVAREWLFHHQKRYLHFFQDTNGLILNSFLPLLGATIQNQWKWTYTVIPRKAKDAAGAIVEFTPPNGAASSVLFNVEYHELDHFLIMNGFPDGDVNDSITSYSAFPGNINHFVVDLTAYVHVLDHTKGKMFEIFNPKYTATNEFKAPARLECMMQDFPKLLTMTMDKPLIGFVSFSSSLVYSPCKNETTSAASKLQSGIPPQCAISAEHDLYALSVAKLKHLGVHIGTEHDGIRGANDQWLGIPISCRGPHVIWSPSFGVCLSTLRQRFPAPSCVFLSARSTLILQGTGQVTIHSLRLDGALRIVTVKGVHLHIHALNIVNSGAEYVEANDDTISQMRGYCIRLTSEKILKFDTPGIYHIQE